MTDAHDEAAKALMPDCRCAGRAWVDCIVCDGSGERPLTDRAELANALRKAAADEREAILSDLEREHARGKAARTRYSHEDRQIIDAENVGVSACIGIVRARAKGGAV